MQEQNKIARESQQAASSLKRENDKAIQEIIKSIQQEGLDAKKLRQDIDNELREVKKEYTRLWQLMKDAQNTD